MPTVLIVPALFASLAMRAPVVSTLQGRLLSPAALTSTVTLFWRPDCGPCLSELGDLAALRTAASPLHVEPVMIDGAPERPGGVAETLAKVGLSRDDTLRVRGRPEVLLSAYGGQPPRLPLAVAFDGAGRVCGHHTGFLGYDQLHAWAAACAGPNAARR